MFKVGDKVFYPMHGAGIINSIDEKEISGNKVSYYTISLPNEIKVMIPLENTDTVGLRKIINEDEANKVLGILESEITEMPENWNKRYNENRDRLKTGDIYEIADIYRNLSLRNREKNLSTGEKKMLLNAKQVLISELSLSSNQSFETIEKRIENKLDENFKNHEQEI